MIRDFIRAIGIIIKDLLSRKLWMTAIVLFYLRADFWAKAVFLDSLTDKEQLTAFIALASHNDDTMKWIVLGFLGITGAVQMGSPAISGVLNRFTQTTTTESKTSSPVVAGHSTKNED